MYGLDTSIDWGAVLPLVAQIITLVGQIIIKMKKKEI